MGGDRTAPALPASGRQRRGRYGTWPSHSPGLLHSDNRMMSSTAARTVTRRLTSNTPGMGSPFRRYACGDSRNVVRQKNTILTPRPLEERLVAAPRYSDILRPDDIDVGLAAVQGSKYVVVEILVREPSQHGYSRRRSINRARIPSGRHRDSFDARISSALLVRAVRYVLRDAAFRRQYPIV